VHTAHIYALSFTSDGLALASSCLERTVKLLDIRSGKEIKPIDGKRVVNKLFKNRPTKLLFD
jgi:WD40 repeat protein